MPLYEISFGCSSTHGVFFFESLAQTPSKTLQSDSIYLKRQECILPERRIDRKLNQTLNISFEPTSIF